MVSRKLVSILLVGICNGLVAIPGTDISIVRLIYSDQNKSIEAEFVNTPVQRKGYDNQPHFIDNETLLFTRELDGQTDAFQLNVITFKIEPLTLTAESEYSPTPLPANVRGDFSAVVAFDGKQRLWTYQNGKPITQLNGSIEPVGYHAWLDKSIIAMFRLAEPHELVIYDLQSKQKTIAAKDIGRTLLSPSPNKLLFIQNLEKRSQVVEYRADTNTTTVLAKLDKQQLDFTWHRKAGLVAAKGNDVFHFTGKQWKKIDLHLPAKINSISRLAISPSGEWLAIVHQDIVE